MYKILVVEDEKNTREGLSEILQSEGYVVEVAEDGATALEMLDPDFDVLLSDLKLPGIMGLDLTKQVQQQNPEIVSIIMTAYGSPDLINCGKDIGVYAWLIKPLNIDHLLALLRQAPVVSTI